MDTVLRATVVVIASASAISALAQEQVAEQIVEPEGPQVSFSVSGGFEHDFETDIDDGGELELTRFAAGIGAGFEVTPEVGLRLFVGVEQWQYDFSGSTGFGGLNPWDDVHTVSLAATFSWGLAPDWSVTAGPLLQFSWESGADMSDGLQGGGAFAVSHRVSDTLTVGAGIGVVSQIEDDVRFFPAVIVDYRLNERLCATSSGTRGVSPFSGVELAYDVGSGWEVALGIDYREHRFRLDDRGVAPDGVGRSTGLPVWLRGSYRPDETVRIDGFIGMIFGGELLLEDDDGQRLSEQDYDATLAVGIGGSIRF